MPLSREEKEYIIELLDQMDRAKAERIMSSLSSFSDWLRSSIEWLFDKIAEWELHRLFNNLMSWLFDRS